MTQTNIFMKQNLIDIDLQRTDLWLLKGKGLGRKGLSILGLADSAYYTWMDKQLGPTL